MYLNGSEDYLKDLHQEGLNGFALVYYSLTAYFQTTNLFRIDPIFLKEGSNHCQTENRRANEYTISWRCYQKDFYYWI